MFRGIERRILFVDDLDRDDLALRLTRILGDGGAVCWAWAFMPNHVHLVVRTSQVGISRLMARVLTGYALRFNRRHERVGYLFQGRFKSRLVVSDADLLNVVRYVHLNPLAGGIVRSLAELDVHPWAGHAAVVGTLPAAGFHSARATLALLGDDAAVPERWRRWMLEGIVPEPDPVTRDPDEPGERTEVDEGLRAKLPPELRPWVTVVCRHFGVTTASLTRAPGSRKRSRARAVLAHVAVDRLGLSVRRTAPLLGVSAAALSRAAARGRLVAREEEIDLRNAGEPGRK
jgi:REP element-mobilizing transposase RayT